MVSAQRLIVNAETLNMSKLTGTARGQNVRIPNNGAQLYVQ
jgi:hypothetical protein